MNVLLNWSKKDRIIFTGHIIFKPRFFFLIFNLQKVIKSVFFSSKFKDKRKHWSFFFIKEIKWRNIFIWKRSHHDENSFLNSGNSKRINTFFMFLYKNRKLHCCLKYFLYNIKNHFIFLCLSVNVIYVLKICSKF